MLGQFNPYNKKLESDLQIFDLNMTYYLRYFFLYFQFGLSNKQVRPIILSETYSILLHKKKKLVY